MTEEKSTIHNNEQEAIENLNEENKKEVTMEEKAEESATEAEETSTADASSHEQTAADEVAKEDKEPSLQEQLDAQKDKYLRLFAEFENYKRRTSKERIELFKTAGQEVIQSLLPVLDDFDRALKEVSKSEDKEIVKGIELIHQKLSDTLKAKGLEVLHVKAGDSFDADLHEAITQIPAPTEEMKGKIMDVIEKGYTLGEKIIRYPKVVTGK